jgi:hypothetical protein
MNAILETLMLRRPVINYVSPAACEIILSGSGVGAFIVLTPFSKIHKVGGLVLTEISPGAFTINWDTTPGNDPPVICYNIYQVVGGELILVSECVNPPDGGGGVPLPPGSPGGDDTYVVTPVTPEGEGPPSDPVTTPVAPPSFWNLNWVLVDSNPGEPIGSFLSSMSPDRFDLKGVQLGRDIFTGLNAYQEWQGSMTYTGPLRSSHLALAVSDLIGVGGQFFQIDFFQNGVLFYSVNSGDLLVVGDHDYDFDVPASAGDTISVTVFMVLGDVNPTGNHWFGLLT